MAVEGIIIGMQTFYRRIRTQICSIIVCPSIYGF